MNHGKLNQFLKKSHSNRVVPLGLIFSVGEISNETPVVELLTRARKKTTGEMGDREEG